MTTEFDAGRLSSKFNNELYEHILPFWLDHSIDSRYGGFFNCLDRDGSVYDPTKHVWMQARQVWMLSKLYTETKNDSQWLETAAHGLHFLKLHALRADGRLFHTLSQKGKPLAMGPGMLTECFYAMALAAHGRACADQQLIDEATDLVIRIADHARQTGYSLTENFNGTPPVRAIAVPMLLLNVLEEVTSANASVFGALVEELVDQLLLHVHDDRQAVLEAVAADGSYLDTSQGRLMNPGHTIEAGWFLMHWALICNRVDWQDKASSMIRLAWDRGWDHTYGGLYHFIDTAGYDPVQAEWFMKLWWPQTEALYALLLNHAVTGEDEDLSRFLQVEEYLFTRYRDSEHPEWFGYLNRQGEVTHRFKAGPLKGFFHIPRALLFCANLLDKMEAGKTGTELLPHTTAIVLP